MSAADRNVPLVRRYDFWNDNRFRDYNGTGALSCAKCGVLVGDPELHWQAAHADTGADQ